MGIAVIIPIYNTEKYLKECIDSVLKQTVPFQQIILMDDGSTDGSYLLAQSYAESHENITLVSQENAGPGAARNRALELVKEDYVMFLDSDDYLVETTVETLNEEIRKTPVDALYFDASVKNQMQNFHKISKYDRQGKVSESLMSGKEYFTECFPHSYIVSPCMVAFRAEFLRENQIAFPEVRGYEDEVVSFLVMMYAKYVRYIPSKLYIRRYRENSLMTTKMTSEKWTALCKCYMMNWEYIQSHVTEFSQAEIKKMKAYFMQKYMSMKRFFSELTQDQKNSVKEIFCEVQNSFCQGISKLGGCIKVEDEPSMNHWYCDFLLELTEEDAIVADYVKKEIYEKEIVDTYKESLQKKLADLPFHLENKTIGIYGTGYHTEQLLKWYTELLGPIRCTICYIDTYKKSYTEKYYNSDVINVRDIDGMIDEIVISSNEYEHQMKKSITELYGDKYKLHTFYENEKDIIFVDYKKIPSVYLNKNKVLVSIIIPVYNVEQYLEECLESVIQQTHKNIEVILINDGSTDNSLRICEDYAGRYSNTKVISQQNQGLGIARNQGIRMAKGEYITFVDSDDWIAKDAIEKWLEIAIKDKDIDFVESAKHIEFDQQTLSCREVYQRGLDGKTVLYTETEKRKYLLKSISRVCMKMYKRAFLIQNEILMPSGKFEDNAVSPEMVFLANKIGVCDGSIYVYRVNRKGSIISNVDNRFYMVDACKYLINRAEKNGTLSRYHDVIKWYVETRLNYSKKVYQSAIEDKKKVEQLIHSYDDFYESYFPNELKYSQYQFYLLGSFGSRTVVQGIGINATQLKEHITFSGLIAQMGQASMNDIGIQNNNLFREEQIQKDISGALSKMLIEMEPSQKTYFIIDLLEERYDIAELYDGNYITLSDAYKESMVSGIKIKKIYRFGTKEHELLWKEKSKVLCDLLRAAYMQKHIILIKAKLSTKYIENDIEYVYKNQDEIQKTNMILERMYVYLEKCLGEYTFVYEYPLDIYSSASYRHGISPQYYDMKFYEDLVDEIRFSIQWGQVLYE